MKNKCSKTMTGKHHWKTEEFRFSQDYCSYRRIPLDKPKCRYCGMVDDRPKKK